MLGSHNLQIGGGFTRALRDFEEFRQPGALTFQSFPDFLLGLNAAQNGTNLFSNVFVSVDLTGQFDRASRNWEASAYIQDSYQVSSRLTVNAGVRWEYLPPLTDATGRPTTVDASLLDPNPPAPGSLAGIVVQANYPGTVPAGVFQTDKRHGPRPGEGAHPRAAHRLRVAGARRLEPRDRPRRLRPVFLADDGTGADADHDDAAVRPAARVGRPAECAGDVREPVPQSDSDRSVVPAVRALHTGVESDGDGRRSRPRPGRVQQFSLGMQTEIARDLMWEIGYVGTRGDHLQRSRSVNQALLASPTNPIRGETTNTVANITQRKPYLGWSTSDLRAVEAEGETEYDGLETSVTKRYSNGLQFLASYTFSKTIDSDGANAEANGQAGAGIGNQNDDAARRGPASFSRPHRFVTSFIYELPWMNGRSGGGALLGGWSIAGVATIQSGQPLTFTGTNANNAFGFTSDRAQLAAGCGADDLVLSGSVEDRIGQYFNTACVGPSIPGRSSAPTAAPPTSATAASASCADRASTTSICR